MKSKTNTKRWRQRTTDMTGSQILGLLMARLGNRTDPTLRANALLELVLFQQTKLERGPVLPWFLLLTDQSLTLTANQRHINLPTGFLRECDDTSSLFILDDDGKQRV